MPRRAIYSRCSSRRDTPSTWNRQHPIIFLPWDDTKFVYHEPARRLQSPLPIRPGEALKRQATAEDAVSTQLTQGDWLVQNVLGFNKKKKEVIFTATKESPLQSNIYKVNVNNGKLTAVGNSEGVHHSLLSASGEYLIDRYFSLHRFPVISTSYRLETARASIC